MAGSFFVSDFPTVLDAFLQHFIDDLSSGITADRLTISTGTDGTCEAQLLSLP
jgi:hypothetical protein